MIGGLSYRFAYFLSLYTITFAFSENFYPKSNLQVYANDTTTYIKISFTAPCKISNFQYENFELTAFDIFCQNSNIQNKNFVTNDKSWIIHRNCSLYIFTHFVDQNRFLFSFDVTNLWLGSDFSHYSFDYEAKNIIPYYTYKYFVPQTVKQGKKYFKRFSEAHLSRQLAFSEIDPPKIMIVTNPRSGTHIMTDIIEKLMGQYVGGLQPREPTNPALYKMEEYGIIKNGPEFHRIIENHKLNMYWKPIAKNIHRYLILVRDPLYSIDSHFHFYATNSSYDGKLPDSVVYWNDFEYFRFMNISSKVWANKMLQFSKSNFIMAFFRNEDMMADGVRTFSEAISFIERVPSKVTYRQELIEQYFKEKTYTSFITQNSSVVPKRKNLHELIPRKIIEMLYEDGKEWLEEFAYDNKYRHYLFGETLDKKGNFDYPLYHRAEPEIKNYMKYKNYSNPMKPLKIKEIDDKAWDREMTNSRLSISKTYKKYAKGIQELQQFQCLWKINFYVKSRLYFSHLIKYNYGHQIKQKNYSSSLAIIFFCAKQPVTTKIYEKHQK